MANSKPKRMVRVNRGAEGPKRRMKVSGAQRAKARSRGKYTFGTGTTTTRDEKGRVTSRTTQRGTIKQNVYPRTAGDKAAARARGAEGPKRSMRRKKK